MNKTVGKTPGQTVMESIKIREEGGKKITNVTVFVEGSLSAGSWM